MSVSGRYPGWDFPGCTGKGWVGESSKLSLLIVLSFMISFMSGPSHAQGADGAERVFFNAKVFTGVPEHPYAEAVAIRGDKIVGVGNLSDVLLAASPTAQKIDLEGKTVLPGLIDSHVHPIMAGLSLVGADVSDQVHSIDELARYAADAKKAGKGMRGDVLYISGLPLEFWSHTDELNLHFSSGDFASVPLFLAGSDGHTSWGNRALLRRAGVTNDFLSHLSAAERAYYGVAKDGDPNGFAVDAGRDKLEAAVPAASKQQYLAGGRAALQYLQGLGITAWLDAWADESVLATYKALADNRELNAHVAAFWVVNPRNDPAKELEIAQKIRRQYAGTPNLTIAGIKVFADGVLEYPSQTAALTRPYRNDGHSGDLLFDPSRFAELAIAADKQGLIIHVHALGDRAVKESLNGIEAARKANGNSGLPHTLTHLQIVDPEDFPRFKQLGVIAALQLLWAAADSDAVDLVKPYIDPDLYRWQYPARSLLDAGATISGASDWFVSSPNVFWAIYQAETRKGPEGVLDPTQRVPREAMFFAYTRNSARALNQQDKIGSLAAGMQADMVLVDRDVLTVSPEEMRDTKVLWTMIGGKTVYRAQP
jgi:predicted amidohydrolase YtcJ